MNNNESVLSFLSKEGYTFEKLNIKQITEFKRKWLQSFVPKNKIDFGIKSFCIDEGGFLWHAFSYEILNALKENSARIHFKSIPKKEAYLLDSISNELYYISDLSNFDVDLLDLENDVVVTSKDFTWTYAKTHEENLAPYFYKKVD